jgi:hypothetical protein
MLNSKYDHHHSFNINKIIANKIIYDELGLWLIQIFNLKTLFLASFS